MHDRNFIPTRAYPRTTKFSLVLKMRTNALSKGIYLQAEDGTYLLMVLIITSATNTAPHCSVFYELLLQNILVALPDDSVI